MLSGCFTIHQGAAVTVEMRHAFGVLGLVLFSCTNSGGSSDSSGSSASPSGGTVQSSRPLAARDATALDAAEAKCAWPCDAAGCVKARSGHRCLVRCEADADCPAQSICLCENDKCSLGVANLRDELPTAVEGSCYPLDPALVQVVEECRREKNCNKHPR